MRDFRGPVRSLRRGVGGRIHGLGVAVAADVRHLQAQVDQLQAELVQARHDRKQDAAWLAAQAEALSQLSAVAARDERLLSIETVSRFIRHARLQTQPLVSVVLPTYDRPDHLRRAMQSVAGQRYERWELLVVDDGGELDSRAVVEEAGDPRVRWMRIAHAGVCAARNAALDEASGDLIAYLDDDNLMDADWLYAVVWAFEQRPEVNALYGAMVVDDLLRVDGTGRASGALPRVFLEPWNRATLRDRNLTDQSAIAHRAGLPGVRFDESLATMGDWDLLLSLTEAQDPLVLPAVACYYTTDAPLRLTASPTAAADEAKVRARAALGEG